MRLAKEGDIDKILSIYEDAKKFMKISGNPNQWINGYPSLEDVEKDLNKSQLYVVEAERLNRNTEIVGVVTLTVEDEESYKKIYSGKWLSDDSYGTIHRMAISSRYRGLGIAGEMLKEVCKILKRKNIYNLRADTHRDNFPMQKFLEKNGFVNCGIIYINGDENKERLAYQVKLGEEDEKKD